MLLRTESAAAIPITDLGYLRQWAAVLGVTDKLDEVLKRAEKGQN